MTGELFNPEAFEQMPGQHSTEGAVMSAGNTEDLFVVWQLDDIDSSFYEDTDDPTPLYVCLLCRDCDHAEADVIRGYDPRDSIFERGGKIVESLGGIDLGTAGDSEYRREIERELLAEFESRRSACIVKGDD